MTSQSIQTRIWLEEPEPDNDNPFATKKAYCHGYDVYGDMVANARWVNMLFLLFQGEAPTAGQADLLEALAIVLANPGPRDPSVHAAMCGGVGGSVSASCLMAALAVGGGQLSGGREIYLAMEGWESCGVDIEKWHDYLAAPPACGISGWPQPEHAPGFDPHGVSTPTSVVQVLDRLADKCPDSRLSWLKSHRKELERTAQIPLALSGIAAAAYTELGFAPEQGEMMHLVLRLPGAAAHALEQRGYGHKKFPFYPVELE